MIVGTSVDDGIFGISRSKKKIAVGAVRGGSGVLLVG